MLTRLAVCTNRDGLDQLSSLTILFTERGRVEWDLSLHRRQLLLKQFITFTYDFSFDRESREGSLDELAVRF